MPVNLTEVSAFTDPVVVPTGGDAHNAASVRTPLQALANRTRFLYDQLGLASLAVDALTARPIRTVASIGALKALTGMTGGELAIVAPANQPLAILMFTAAVIAPDNDRWVVAPTAGGGTWFNVLAGYATDTGGADGHSLRWAVDVPNRIVSVSEWASGVSDFQVWDTVTTTAAFAASPAALSVTGAKAGDKLLVDAVLFMEFQRAVGGTASGARVRLTGGVGAYTPLNGAITAFPAGPASDSQHMPLSFHRAFTVASDGTFDLRIERFKQDAADTLYFRGTASIRATLIRPLLAAEPLASGFAEPCRRHRRGLGADDAMGKAVGNLCWAAVPSPRLLFTVAAARSDTAGAGSACLPHRALGAGDHAAASVGGCGALVSRAGLRFCDGHATTSPRAGLPGRPGRAGTARPRATPGRAARSASCCWAPVARPQARAVR